MNVMYVHAVFSLIHILTRRSSAGLSSLLFSWLIRTNTLRALSASLKLQRCWPRPNNRSMFSRLTGSPNSCLVLGIAVISPCWHLCTHLDKSVEYYDQFPIPMSPANLSWTLPVVYPSWRLRKCHLRPLERSRLLHNLLESLR